MSGSVQPSGGDLSGRAEPSSGDVNGRVEPSGGGATQDINKIGSEGGEGVRDDDFKGVKDDEGLRSIKKKKKIEN